MGDNCYASSILRTYRPEVSPGRHLQSGALLQVVLCSGVCTDLAMNEWAWGRIRCKICKILKSSLDICFNLDSAVSVSREKKNADFWACFWKGNWAWRQGYSCDAVGQTAGYQAKGHFGYLANMTSCAMSIWPQVSLSLEQQTKKRE